jgi:hypothetical protein
MNFNQWWNIVVVLCGTHRGFFMFFGLTFGELIIIIIIVIKPIQKDQSTQKHCCYYAGKLSL